VGEKLASLWLVPRGSSKTEAKTEAGGVETDTEAEAVKIAPWGEAVSRGTTSLEISQRKDVGENNKINNYIF